MKLTTEEQIVEETPVMVSLRETKWGVTVCVSGKAVVELQNRGNIYVCMHATNQGFKSLGYWLGNEQRDVNLK